MKAIDKIKLDISKPLACKEITICDVDDLIKLLNLIEKQQAELDSYTNLKQIEQEHQKINGELRTEIEQLKDELYKEKCLNKLEQPQCNHVSDKPYLE